MNNLIKFESVQQAALGHLMLDAPYMTEQAPDLIVQTRAQRDALLDMAAQRGLGTERTADFVQSAIDAMYDQAIASGEQETFKQRARGFQNAGRIYPTAEGWKDTGLTPPTSYLQIAAAANGVAAIIKKHKQAPAGLAVAPVAR